MPEAEPGAGLLARLKQGVKAALHTVTGALAAPAAAVDADAAAAAATAATADPLAALHPALHPHAPR